MMRRFVLGCLVWIAVFVLAAGGALAAGEQTQTQVKLQTQTPLQLQEGECACEDCPCGECLDCLQSQSGECFCWEGEPSDPWMLQFILQLMFMGGE